jgi:hypothetical protein
MSVPTSSSLVDRVLALALAAAKFTTSCEDRVRKRSRQAITSIISEQSSTPAYPLAPESAHSRQRQRGRPFHRARDTSTFKFRVGNCESNVGPRDSCFVKWRIIDTGRGIEWMLSG